VLKRIASTVKSVFRGRRMENDLDDELRFHVERETEENVRRGMPNCSSVRFAGRCDCSTVLMISSFSAAGYLIRRRPHPRSCFF